MAETATEPYATWTNAAFPGATLVLYGAPSGPVAVGAFEGIPHGVDRVARAHREMARKVAAAARARTVMRDYPDGIGHLRTPVPTGSPDPVASRAGMLSATVAVLAGVLSETDAFVATRRMETDLCLRGDDALLAWVRGHLDAVGARATSPEGMAEGAAELAAASPGPATLVRRMDAARQGLPTPPDAVGGQAATECGVSLVVGTVRVESPALAPWPVEITVRVTHDVGSIEYEDGAPSYAGIDVHLHHDPATWCPGSDGLAYGDDAVTAAVHDLFRRRGLGDHLPEWSEMGRQTAFHGDMDAPPSLALALWPDLADAPARSPRP